jgi:hypothetical protein
MFLSLYSVFKTETSLNSAFASSGDDAKRFAVQLTVVPRVSSQTSP